MLPFLAPGVPLWLLVVNWLNDTLTILLAAALVRRFAPRPLRFTMLRAMGIYLACAVLVAPALSAFVGAAGLVTLGTPYWQAWWTWFLGDALASLILTPAIVMWVTAGRAGLRPVSQQQGLEVLLLGAALLFVGWLLIFSRLALVIDDAIYYLPLPLLVWAAVRLGPRGIASALTVVTCFAIASIAGIWGIMPSTAMPREVLSLQLLLIATAVPLLLVAAQIEERQQAVEKVERQAEELDRVFEAVADGIAVYDREGRTLRTNTALQRLLHLDDAPAGYGKMTLPERLVLFATRDKAGRLLSPDELPLSRALAGEMMEGLNAMDLRSRALDGRELEMNVSAVPLLDGTGELVGVVCVLRDQTERKRLEREVAEQAEQLDRIVEGMGEGLFVYDTQGQIVRTNAAARRLLGLGAAPPNFSQWPGEERITLYAPHERQDGQMLSPNEWLAARALAGSGDVLRTTEARDVRMRTLDGRELEVSASVAPLHNPVGQVVGAVLLLSDRTERNQLVREREEARASELALRELNQQLDTFVAVAAHDLNQPVTAGKLVISLAQRQIQRAVAKSQHATGEYMVPFTQVKSVLDAAQRSLDRLWRLVQQLLDVTRARQGILTLNRQPCLLEDLVRAGVEEQRLLTPGRALTLDLSEAGESPIMVDADAERLSQVLANYLTNAVRYSPIDQPIEVALKLIHQVPEDGGGTIVQVLVRDHGPGIAPEQHTTIWDRFQRAHSASEAGGGLGLGLYIARTIIERHGGNVGVESTVGEGATFWFTLPLAPSEASDAEVVGDMLSAEPPALNDVAPDRSQFHL
jgi:signal transduction histidine kinase/integral membrane sensor domain MASE1